MRVYAGGNNTITSKTIYRTSRCILTGTVNEMKQDICHSTISPHLLYNCHRNHGLQTWHVFCIHGHGTWAFSVVVNFPVELLTFGFPRKT